MLHYLPYCSIVSSGSRIVACALPPCSDSLHDQDLCSSLQRLGTEPMPYLAQFSDSHQQQCGGGQRALRHMYAAALAQMGSGPHQVERDSWPEGEESQLPQHERKEQTSRTTSLDDSLDGTAVSLHVRAHSVLCSSTCPHLWAYS